MEGSGEKILALEDSNRLFNPLASEKRCNISYLFKAKIKYCPELNILASWVT